MKDGVAGPKRPRPAGSPLVSDSRSLHEVDAELHEFEATGGRVAFIDSITTLGGSDQWWEDLTNGPLGIAGIAHQNARGTPFGGHRVAHDPDVHLSVSEFNVRIEKSRWFDDGLPRSWAVVEPEVPSPTDAQVLPFLGEPEGRDDRKPAVMRSALAAGRSGAIPSC